MEESVALQLVALAVLKEQPSVVLELLSAYKHPETFESFGFWRGYSAALEWVLSLRAHKSFYVPPDDQQHEAFGG